MSNLQSKWTIVMFPRIQIDTTVSYFLLKYFGNQKFPGIQQAELKFLTKLPDNKTVEDLEASGHILIDLGGSKFDHHTLGADNNKYSSSHLIARYLGVDTRRDLRRLLEFARRDDLEGRGTISHDAIDRAFGLSALLTNLNKTFSDDPKKVLDVVLPLIVGHYIEENRRYEIMPAAHKKLENEGRSKMFKAVQQGRTLKIIYVETDDQGMAGYLRSGAVGADVVVQRASSGHVNFVLRQKQNIKIHQLSRHVKLLEAKKSNIILDIKSPKELEAPGRTNGLPHWYYDTRANTLQNGGVSPDGVPATLLTFDEIVLVVKKGLDIPRDNSGMGNTRFRERREKGVLIIE